MLRSLFITSIMLFIGLLSLRAQETYELHEYYDGSQRLYDIYKVDLLNATGTLHCRIEGDTIERIAENVTVIHDFELNSGRDTVYLLDREGELFRCDCTTGEAVRLGDFSMPTPGFFTWDDVENLHFLSDSVLLAFKDMVGTYNLNSGEFTEVRKFNNSAELLADTGLVGKVITFYKGDLIYYHSKPLHNDFKLFYLDMDNPDTLKELLDLGFPPQPAPSHSNMIEYRDACDSSELWMGRKEDENNVEYWYSVNLETGEFSKRARVFKTDIPSVASNVKHYNAIPWSQCHNYIDLDEDDSTAPGADFLFSTECSMLSIPIADEDLLLRHESVMDSIVLQVESSVTGDFLEIDPGNYDITQSRDHQLVIQSINATSLSELNSALQGVRYSYLGTDARGTVSIRVTPWSDGEAGLEARAVLELPEQLPDAGEDRHLTRCRQDSSTSLGSLIDPTEMDVDGRFLDADQTPQAGILWSWHQVGVDSAYYVVETDHCRDTSLWVLEIIEAAILEIEDIYLCDSETSTIDLSDIDGQVEWSDGSTEKVREISSAGSYSVMVGIGTDCEATEDFSVYQFGPPETELYQDSLCPGDDYVFFGQLLDNAGSFSDTLFNEQGCDSLIRNLVLTEIQSVELEYDGSLEYCEGESTTISILTEGEAWTWDGEAVGNDIVITAPGEYLLEGVTPDGCLISQVMVAVEYPLPQIEVQDLIDTVHTSDLQMKMVYDTEIDRIEWSPTTHLSCTDCPQPYVEHPGVNSYTVTVFNAEGCSATSTVQISYLKSEYYLATVVHAASEWQENRRLYLQGRGDVLYDLSVYNRWGSLIYEGRNLVLNNPSQGWLPREKDMSGVYLYDARVHDVENTSIVGDVTVIW